MTLSQKIQDDVKQAMRDRDQKTLGILRMVASSIKNKAIDLKKELEDADALAVVKSDLKKLQDALADFTKAAREDLVEQTKFEIDILKKYLPPEMSEEELETKIRAKLADLGITDLSGIGKAVGAVMADLKGLADGSRVKAMIEKILS